jgi:hypothetical protein
MPDVIRTGVPEPMSTPDTGHSLPVSGAGAPGAAPRAADQPDRPGTVTNPHPSQPPNVARIYDYLLGGTDNYAVDRAAADRIRAVMPEAGAAAWANRGFHNRAAKWMAHEGIAQLVDIGCGLPTMRNTHDVVREVNPAARVAYIDHDPEVMAIANALLAPDGQTSVILADIRDPASLLTSLHLDGLIELAEPAGLLCTAVLHFVADEDDPHDCLRHLTAALAPGSYVAISHVTADQISPLAVATGVAVYAEASDQLYPRTGSVVGRFFAGLEIVPPYEGAGAELCHIGLWGCEDPAEADDDSSRPWWAGVGRLG